MAWDTVSLSWVHTVAVKHTLTGFLLLLAAYVAISIGPVRRFFGLPLRPAQQDTNMIYALAILFGLGIWGLDALVDYLIFNPQGKTFLECLIMEAGLHEMFMRSIYVFLLLMAGLWISRVSARRRMLQSRLEHQNRVLAAIRNVNQLITHEKARDRLLNESCRLLTETHGYYNAWIALLNNDQTVESYYHAGFNGGFEPMAERLRAGSPPHCALKTIESGGVHIMTDPPTQCLDCPLAGEYGGRAGLTQRLEHDGRVFGWLSVSTPEEYAHDKEEADLFVEVGGDLAFALSKIEDAETLQKSEDKFRNLFDNTSDAVFIHDMEGRFLEVNDIACTSHGYTRDELLQMRLRDIVVSEDLLRAPEIFQSIEQKGGSVFESTHVSKNGSKIPVEVSSRKIEYEGKPCILSVVRDISERKQAEEALRMSEAKFAKAFHNAPLLITISSVQDGRYIEVNETFVRVTGYSRETVLGVTSTDLGFVTPKEREQLLENLKSDGYVREMELELTCADGKTIHCQYSGELIEVEGETRLLSIASDITEHKRVEKEREHSRSLLKAAFESTADGILVVDRDGTWSEFNQRFIDMWEIPASFQESGDDQAALDYVRDKLADPDGFLALVHEIYDKPEEITFDVVELQDGRAFERYSQPQKLGNTVVGRVWSFRDVTDRKRAERELQDSEQRFQRMLSVVPDMISIHDPQMNIVYSNWQGFAHVPEEKRIFYTKCHKTYRGFDEICPDCKAKDAITTKKPFQEEIVLPDGTWVDLRVIPLFNEAGQVELFMEWVRDITEQKQGEDALRKSESRLREILDSMEIVPIQGYDRERRVVYWNAASEKIYGYTKKEALGNKLEDLIIPDPMREQVIAHVDHWLEGGEAIPAGELVLRDKQGNEVNVYSSHIMHETTSGEKEMFCIDIDLRALRQSEEERERQRRIIELNNRIANVFLTAPADEIHADVLNEILNALNSQYGYFGYIDEERNLVCPSMTRDIWDKCQVEDKSIVFPQDIWGGLWGQSLKEKSILIANEGLRFPEGHVMLENAMAVPILHHEDLIGQFVVGNKSGGYDAKDRELLESVASQTAPILKARLDEEKYKRERANLEEQLQQSQKMEAIGTLAGGVAHDFNNILMAILGNSQMVLDKIQKEDPIFEEMQQIYQAGERATSLTNQLLAFSRKQVIQPKILHLGDKVNELEKMLQRIMGEDIELHISCEDHLGTIKADPGQIDQIVMNLAVNARDAMPKGGSFHIDMQNIHLDQSVCDYHLDLDPGDYIFMSISDSGGGMPKDIQHKIFEPFFTTKEKGKGTGLGLSTVYGIVK
ncbi:PAS domain S-box protein, partial [bacterium]|nr:PAS domain S-box protein [bacterium]